MPPPMKNQQGMKDCPALWNEVMSSGKHELLLPLINHEPYGLIGASFYNVDTTDAKKFDYYIAVRKPPVKIPEELTEVEVPANSLGRFSMYQKNFWKDTVCD